MARHTVFKKKGEKAAKGAAALKTASQQAHAAPDDVAPQGVAAVWMHISQVHPWDKNPRKNEQAVAPVVASIREFGFPTALTVYPDGNRLVVGHTRRLAIQALLADEPTFTLQGAPGPGFVPVRFHDFGSEVKASAYALADNRLGENAEWDNALLHSVAQEIIGGEGLGMLGIVGFDDDEIATILSDAGVPDGEEEGGSQGPPKPEGPHKSPQGDAPPATMRIVQLLLTEEQHAEYLGHIATLQQVHTAIEPGEVVLKVLRAATEAL